MKAMILAAGRGERMRPLTDTIPKPLAPFGKRRLIEPLLENLNQAGIKQIVINVSYLAQQIIDYLGDGSRYGLEICYSLETEVGGLETGGGVLQALPLLGEEPFLIVSSDIVTNFPFATLGKKRISGGAHLVLVDNPSFHPQGDFHLQEDGLVHLQGNNMLTFASIGILHPQLFAGCTPSKFPLLTVFKQAIQSKQMTGEHYRGPWHNIGTIDQLKTAQKI